ncbi:MAG: hypothetical protein NVS2B3_09090 [Vulcanimicrobiaceae bacterium]
MGRHDHCCNAEPLVMSRRSIVTSLAATAVAVASTGKASAVRGEPGRGRRPNPRLVSPQATLRLLRDRASSVSIVHVPDDVLTRATLRLRDLERFDGRLERQAIRDRTTIVRIVDLLCAAWPIAEAAGSPYDARWALRFHLPGGDHVVAFDRFGARGAIDAGGVRFGDGAFVSRLTTLLARTSR